MTMMQHRRRGRREKTDVEPRTSEDALLETEVHEEVDADSEVPVIMTMMQHRRRGRREKTDVEPRTSEEALLETVVHEEVASDSEVESHADDVSVAAEED